MNKKHAIGATLILVLLAGVGWAFFSGDDAEFVEVKKMRDDLLQKSDTMSHDQRRAGFESLRDKARDFSPEQKRRLREGGRKHMTQRMDNILALPPKEQRAEIDQLIDRIESWKNNREERGDRGRGDRGNDLTTAERDQKRKERLDRTTPEMRAKRDRMKDLVNQRREERGMEPMQGGPFRFGGR